MQKTDFEFYERKDFVAKTSPLPIKKQKDFVINRSFDRLEI